MDRLRSLAPGFAIVVAGTALALVVINHLPARQPLPQVAAAVRAPEVSAEAPAAPAQVPPPAVTTDDAQLAATIARPELPVPIGPRTQDDARLSPLRLKLPKVKRPRARSDARDPSFAAAPAAPAPSTRAAAITDPAAAESAAVARRALAFVGADPAAEEVWVDAINDPARSAHERSDLIEDLNEDGFADPHNPTIEELPLIENRLALIESLADDAMDETNAAAFAEAYKDLVNMYAKVLEQHAASMPPPDFTAEGPTP
jgi:hypothetical protein